MAEPILTPPRKREVRAVVQKVADALHQADLVPTHDLAIALIYMGSQLAASHAPHVTQEEASRG